MEQLFTLTTLTGILHSTIRLATPYLFASLGETISQRSGVLNLGVEGQMLMGAFAAFFVVVTTGSLLGGVVAAIFVGALLGLLMALVSVSFRAEQGISGIGMYLLGLGLSSLLFRLTLGSVQSVRGFAELALPGLSSIPVLGPALFKHSLLVYVAFALVPMVAYLLNRTTWGLNIRAVGDNPQAADTLGVPVIAIRYATVTVGGAMAAMGGASLSISAVNIFQENMTGGIGFIAVALVYFGGWRPVGVMLGILLFSLVSALQIWLQLVGIGIPSDLAVMLPYILTIIALALAPRRTGQPAALTRPFNRGMA
ncbi:ABC transporter permease [Candidatus Chloroploca sp. Khr17]|uniref:ABC transporter permease n=1 Tax=Candidatus Chloroploca sp. Khr17 TaxID=2496869 RepID=UPI00101C22DD|nr:ABC transporter permease [Candidatus Chloroploca sp. Khr17]